MDIVYTIWESDTAGEKSLDTIDHTFEVGIFFTTVGFLDGGGGFGGPGLEDDLLNRGLEPCDGGGMASGTVVEAPSLKLVEPI